MQLRCSHCRGYCRGRVGANFQWVRVSHKQKVVFEAAVEVSRSLSRCSRLLSRCRGRRRSVEAAVEVFEAAVDVSRPTWKC
jgi:hypothetical protein